MANLTAKNFLEEHEKIKVFSKDAYISVDFLEKKTEIIQMEELNGEPGPFDLILDLKDNQRKDLINHPEISMTNAIKEELQTFHSSIVNDTAPIVPLEDGYNGLKIANVKYWTSWEQ